MKHPLLVLGFCLLPAAAAGQATASHPTADETRREFQQICRQLRDGSNEFFGSGQLAALEAVLRKPDSSAEERVRAGGRRGLELLRLGRNSEAQEQLSATLQLAATEKLPVPLQLQALMDLGLALLRIGEVTNCVGQHTPEMCIFPIAPGGRHRDPRAARDAMRAFLGVLAGAPDYPQARWLLNVAAMTIGEYPGGVPPQWRIPPERLRAEADVGRFPDIAHEIGLTIFDTSGGALIEDFDGDGYLDVMTSAIDPCTPLRFFRSDRQGRFADRAREAGLDGQLGGLNLVHADYDNDGDPDVLVLRGGWMAADGRIRNSLLRNDGTGRFTDVTAAVGLAEPAYPTQTAAWADFDLDGDLDLAIGNEGPVGGSYPLQLFRNDLPEGRFTDVAAAAGLVNGYWAKGVAWGDYDGDGDPDLYVSNIGPNRLFRNNGDGTFADVAAQLGVTEPAERSFATWFFDFDNDGDLDLFVADYTATVAEIASHYFGPPLAVRHPRLYRNDGPAEGGHRFTDASVELGLTAPSLPMGANFGDLDNDGFLDLYLGTGLPVYEALTPNLMYRNDQGRRFQDVTFSGGFGHLQKGHGVAFGDLDNDGDQDVFEQMGGAFPGDAYHSVLYHNPGHGHRWLQLRLVGTRAPRSGQGAQIHVELTTTGGQRRHLYRTAGTGGSFGGSPLRLELGLGDARTIDRLEIRWPGDPQPQLIQGLQLDRRYEIRQDDPTPHPIQLERLQLGGTPGGHHHGGR